MFIHPSNFQELLESCMERLKKEEDLAYSNFWRDRSFYLTSPSFTKILLLMILTHSIGNRYD